MGQHVLGKGHDSDGRSTGVPRGLNRSLGVGYTVATWDAK